jgi:Tol biopolymer transport system component/DNA-binding winged helix-turn-helix (wHTH) protein
MDLSASAPRLVRFGVFELDLRSGELRKAGARLNLPDQPLQLLTALLERPADLVTRDELRQRLWAGDTFVDFEHGLNAAVKRLRDTLGDSADAPRFIETVPRRGYRFIAPIDRPGGTAGPSRDQVQEPESLPPRSAGEAIRHQGAGWWWIAILLILAVATFGGWKFVQSHLQMSEERGAMRVVPLSTLRGWSTSPTFSPDGRQVAYSGDEGGVTSHIYVQVVGSAEPRRLTPDAHNDWGPSWSPDGERIAFFRETSAGSRIYLISAVSGSDSKLSDFAATAPISWSKDGKYLAVRHVVPPSAVSEESGIWVLPLDGGSPRPITHPTPPAFDTAPAFSPDGHRLAYASCRLVGCDLYVVPLGADLMPSDSPTRLTGPTINGIYGVAWTRDGQSLVFNGFNASTSHLLRVPANGSRLPVRIEVAGLGALAPATARTRDILAFSRMNTNIDISSFEVGQLARSIITSSFADFQPELSADGTRLAFCSERTGDSVEIWVAAADGSGAHQLTHGPNRWQCSPHWSPHASSIVFDSQADDGHWHVWMVDSEGGTPRQITHGPGSQNMPSWSHDGRWIYFTADDGTRRNVFRIPARGGSPEQITQMGGAYPQASADGVNLLYQRFENVDSPLLVMPLAGGAFKQLVGCVRWSAFATSPHGIYYAACVATPDRPLHLLDPATGIDRLVGKLEGLAWVPGLAVSPDGSTIFYSRFSNISSDLMLIENFK